MADQNHNNSASSSTQPMSPEEAKQYAGMFFAMLILLSLIVSSLALVFGFILYGSYWLNNDTQGVRLLKVATTFMAMSLGVYLLIGGDYFIGAVPLLYGPNLHQWIVHSFLKGFAGHDFPFFIGRLQFIIWGSLFGGLVLTLILSGVRYWAFRESKNPHEDDRSIFQKNMKCFLEFMEGPLGFVMLFFEILALPIHMMCFTLASITTAGEVERKSAVVAPMIFCGVITIFSVFCISDLHMLEMGKWTLFGLCFGGGLGAAGDFVNNEEDRNGAFFKILLGALAGLGLLGLHSILPLTIAYLLSTFAIFVAGVGIVECLSNCLRSLLGLSIEEGAVNEDPREDGYLVGVTEKGKPYRLNSDQLNHHVHIVGASGFGKTNFLSHLLVQHIQQGRGLLFLDLKSDLSLLKSLQASATQCGRARFFKIFSASDVKISSSYNLFRHGDPSELKDKLIGAFEWSETFYQKEAESFLLRLFRALVYLRDHQGLSFHLGDVYQCLTEPKALLLLANQLPSTESEKKSDLIELSQTLESTSKYENLQGLRTDIENLVKAEFGPLLQPQAGGIDLFESMQKGNIIYVLLDSRRYGKSAERLGRMILQDISTASAKRNQLSDDQRELFMVAIDEFAPLVTDGFVRLLQQARSSGLSIVIAHQELADLRTLSESTQNQIMQNTSMTVAFLQKLPDSAEILAGMVGTYETKDVTRQKNENASWFEPKYTGVASERKVEKYKVHPNEFKGLSRGECIIISKYPTDSYARVKVNKAELKAATSAVEPVADELSDQKISVRDKLFGNSDSAKKPLDVRKMFDDYQKNIISKPASVSSNPNKPPKPDDWI